MLNPKAGLFFLAVIPQFIPPHAAATWYALGYAALDSVIALGWLTALAWVSDRAGSWIRRPQARRALDRAAGTVLIGLGLKVAAEALSA